MCMMVYIAAPVPLALVPWNESQPAFHVCELREAEVAVQQQFDVANVFYAGSHEMCGCGFQYGQYPQWEDEDRPLKRASLDAFASYLAEQLTRTPFIQIYACWDGDQSASPEHHRSLTPSSLHAEDFFFLEKELSIVKPNWPLSSMMARLLQGIGTSLRRA